MIDRVEVSVHVHATEDEEKVLRAVSNVLGLEGLAPSQVLRGEGHHGNPIVTIMFRIKGKEAEKAVRHIFKSLEPIELELLKADLENRSEGSKLYLRFDKQEAYRGKLRITSGSDVVRVVIVFKGRKVTKKLIEELGVAPEDRGEA